MNKLGAIAVFSIALLLAGGSYLSAQRSGRSGARYAHQEDKAHTTGAIGAFILGVENEDQATLSTPDKAYTAFAVTPEGNLLIECLVGCGSSTEYTEGDTDASITGVAFMWEDGSDTLRAVSAAKPLPVDGSGVTQPVSATNLDVQIGGSDTLVVSAINLDVQIGGSDVVTVDLAGNNDVTITGTATVTQNTVSAVDAGNSSTSTLNAGIAFTGTGVDITLYASVTVFIAASHDSGAGGISLELSQDNTNWDENHTFTFDVSEHTTREFIVPTHAQYFRIVYTNGGTNQTHFRLQTMLHTTPEHGELHRLSSEEVPDSLGTLVKSVIFAQAAGSGNFVSVNATAGGNLKVAVEEIDDADFLAADGAALGKGILLQGDDTTDRKNIHVDATTGDVQVDVTNTVTVTAADLDVQSGGGDLLLEASFATVFGADTIFGTAGSADADVLSIQGIASGTAVEVNLAGNNDVVATAGLLHGNSPTTEVEVLLMIDGSGDTDIVTTNLSKSSAITVTGSGRITKVCLVVEGTSPFSEDGTIYFFDADPAINSNTADMTVAEAITVVAMVSLTGTDYNDNFATIKINCQAADESFHAITHVVYEQEGATTIANQDFRLHIWYRRDA